MCRIPSVSVQVRTCYTHIHPHPSPQVLWISILVVVGTVARDVECNEAFFFHPSRIDDKLHASSVY